MTLLGRPFLATLVAVVAVAIGLVALPYHDIMVEPEYWWECLLVQCNVWMVMCAMLFATNTPSIMNMDSLWTWSTLAARNVKKTSYKILEVNI